MKINLTLLMTCVLLCCSGTLMSQEVQDTFQSSAPIVDNVWLKDGSTLSGTILKWELARGMEFKLITGATLIIPKTEIAQVNQGVPFSMMDPSVYSRKLRGPKPYAFREHGLYNTFSVFLNLSNRGGAGVHYSMGHRFNRLLGVGLGFGIETHDFDHYRNIMPVFVEARGFLLKKKITPYYALKVGYGFALKNVPNGEIDAKGGFHFSPEIGVRFGGKSVNYYLGIEYKLQNATYTTQFNPWEGQGIYTDELGYRRFEMRTGILF